MNQDVPYIFGPLPGILIESHLEVKYSVYSPRAEKIIEGVLTLRKDLYPLYGGFIRDWEEVVDRQYNMVYYHNRSNGNSVWDSPLFLLIAFIDNEIPSDFKPLNWVNIDDNIIQIQCQDGCKNSHRLIFHRLSKTIEIEHDKEDEESQEDRESSKGNSNSVSNSDLNEQTPNTKFDFIQREYYLEKYSDQIQDFRKKIEEYYKNSQIKDFEDFQSLYEPKFELPIELQRGIFDEEIKSLMLKNPIPLVTNNKALKNKFKSLILTKILENEISLSTRYKEFFEKYYLDNIEIFDSIPDKEKEFILKEIKLIIRKDIESGK